VVKLAIDAWVSCQPMLRILEIPIAKLKTPLITRRLLRTLEILVSIDASEYYRSNWNKERRGKGVN
jgi:hypothetical protein